MLRCDTISTARAGGVGSRQEVLQAGAAGRRGTKRRRTSCAMLLQHPPVCRAVQSWARCFLLPAVRRFTACGREDSKINGADSFEDSD